MGRNTLEQYINHLGDLESQLRFAIGTFIGHNIVFSSGNSRKL
jgi:hypothetical protein